MDISICCFLPVGAYIDIEKMDDVSPLPPIAQNVRPNYLGYECCHLALIMSFAERVCAIAPGKQTHGVKFLPTEIACIAHLSIMTFHPILMAPMALMAYGLWH